MKNTPKVTENPRLIQEWDYEKNQIDGLDPAKLTSGSGQMAHWICRLGHTWKATINCRNRGNGCPYCGGRKAWKGFNDFESRYPELAKEWHPTKNKDILPSNITYGSGKKVWWLCKRNHEYQAPPRDRSRGNGCPICAATLKTSFPEQAVYYYIKKCFTDAVNRYTDIFDNKMELDIYIPSLKVGIEYDGSAYHTVKRIGKDNEKYSICKENGIKLIRIYETAPSSKWVLYDQKIEVPNGQRKYLDRVISQLCYELGHPIDVNIDRDRFEILSYVQTVDSTLAEEFPRVASEWDYEANYPFVPSNFPPYSNEKFSWKCKYCGKKWSSMICNRTANGDHPGCKSCKSKRSREKQIADKLLEKGSLFDLYPNLMDEWDYTKNKLDPRKVLPGSAEKAYWICKVCGFKWEAPINKRTSGHKCLHCTHQVAMTGLDDLATTHPLLAAEWDYEENEKDPSNVLPGCNEKMHWICSTCGYKWYASVNSRTSKSSGCPCCSGRVPMIGVNDLKTLYPALAAEWDYESNEKPPEEYKAGSSQVVGWKCSNCGNTWSKQIVKRVYYPKCPKCKVNVLETTV